MCGYVKQMTCKFNFLSLSMHFHAPNYKRKHPTSQVVQLVIYLDASHSISVPIVLMPRRPLFATPSSSSLGALIHPIQSINHSFIHSFHNLLVSVVLLCSFFPRVIPLSLSRSLSLCCSHSPFLFFSLLFFSLPPIHSFYLDIFDLAGSKIPTNRER
jgi:hypothetical protein